MEDDDNKTTDPGELPADPERTAGEAAGLDRQASEDDAGPAPEELDQDPAYGFDTPESDAKGG